MPRTERKKNSSIRRAHVGRRACPRRRPSRTGTPPLCLARFAIYTRTLPSSSYPEIKPRLVAASEVPRTQSPRFLARERSKLRRVQQPQISMAQEEQQVLLRSADLVKFAVPASLAQRAGRVAAAVDAGERVVELPRGVSGKGLATAVAYYKARADAEAHGADMDVFDDVFVGGLTYDAAIDLIHAAHHLGDAGLFNLFVGYRVN